MFNQTTVLGSIVELSFIGYALRLRGIKGFIKRGLLVRIKIIKHETNFFSMGIMLINECL